MRRAAIGDEQIIDGVEGDGRAQQTFDLVQKIRGNVRRYPDGWGEAAPLTGLLLTIAMLNEFIEKILVHERDRKGSIQTTQEVEIYFNFVGRFIPPAFGEVELTP